MAPRWILTLFLVCTTASAAFPKDLCVQIDGGPDAGSAMLLRRVKLTTKAFGPLYGYFARFQSAPTPGFVEFSPLNGSSLRSSSGPLILGFGAATAALAADGSVADVGSGALAGNVTCTPSPNGAIDVGNACTVVLGTTQPAHIVACNTLPSPP